VSVTGISGASTFHGNPMRVLRPRDDSDIVITGLNVAYIYDTSPPDASHFKDLLDSQSLPTTLIGRSQVTSTSLKPYGVILIGTDTGNWSNQAQVNAVLGTKKPIIAIGTGGAYFLDKVTSPDLYLGKAHSALVTRQFGAEPVGGDIYSYPYVVDLEPLLNLYASPGPNAESLYDPPGGVTRMLGQPLDPDRFLLASEEDRFYQWGFCGAPDTMTITGKQLFVNLVFSTAR